METLIDWFGLFLPIINWLLSIFGMIKWTCFYMFRLNCQWISMTIKWNFLKKEETADTWLGRCCKQVVKRGGVGCSNLHPHLEVQHDEEQMSKTSKQVTVEREHGMMNRMAQIMVTGQNTQVQSIQTQIPKIPKSQNTQDWNSHTN